MNAESKAVIWSVVTVLLVGALATVLLGIHRRQRVTLQGAVIREDSDPQKRQPIPDVQITATAGLTVGQVKSDASGFFSLKLPKGFRRQPVTFEFHHPDYRPLILHESGGEELYIAHMIPLGHSPDVEPDSDSGGPKIVVSNIRVRYSIKTTAEADVGSAVKTFEVANVGDVPCHGQPPCSLDGRWKAGIDARSLDAGEGNEFRNARASCIAGPCPFTKIELGELTHGGRTLTVSARDWSDTATFLVEAEVVHPMVSNLVRLSYPVVFGQALSFSLPGAAEGPSIEAEINGEDIVFPLGPNLFLSWAECTAAGNKDQSRVYRCVLKPGYRFR
jgi:hypothetical protein